MDVHAANDDYENTLRTSLLLAAERGDEMIVKELLATSSINPNSMDNYGRTPLSRAAENQQF